MEDINTVKGDMRDYPVQSAVCYTCPFEGQKPLPLSPQSHARYLENLIGKGQHICHSSNGTRICKGGRNIQIKCFYMMGLLPEPTDEAFNKAIDDANPRS